MGGEDLTRYVMEQAKRADAGARIIDNIITHSILPRLSSLMLRSVLEQNNYEKVTLTIKGNAIEVQPS